MRHRHHHLRPRLRHRQHRVPPQAVGSPRPAEPDLGADAGRLARGRRACQPAARVSARDCIQSRRHCPSNGQSGAARGSMPCSPGWHGCCCADAKMGPGADAPGQRGMNRMPMLDRRRLLLSSTAGLAAAAAPGLLLPRRAAAADLVVGFIYVGPKDDYGYNQAHAEGAAALKAHGGRHRHRGGERPRDGRRPEDHGEHDQPGRRHARLPDLVRLLRPAHAEDVREVSRRAVPPLRRHVERGQAPDEYRLLFRLYRHGPVPERHRRRPHLARPRRSASSPPSRSRRCCSTSTASPLGARIGRSDDHHAR